MNETCIEWANLKGYAAEGLLYSSFISFVHCHF